MSEGARPRAARIRMPAVENEIPFPVEPVGSPPLPERSPPVPAPPPMETIAFGARSQAAPTTGAKHCSVCGERYPIDFRVCPRDAVQLEDVGDTDDPYLGIVIGDVYRICERIGEGGMGQVYRAQHVRLKGRRFAVKIMHRDHLRSQDLVRRFRREAETAHAASHPNVVQVFDVGDTADGVPFIVTELLEGEDLAARLDREGKLPHDEAIHIVRSLCAALSSAHAQGVVHRDLKPDNVFLVDGDVPGLPVGMPQVKLIDFGIARLEDPSASTRTRTGVIMGTPAFMAPEQARGERVDHRADIYSVGAVLYRSLTGHLPYDDPDPAATLMQLLTHEPEPPRALAPEIPQAVELVIERAMARDPEERWSSFAELDDALARLAGVSQESSALRPGSSDAAPTEEPRPARIVHRARPKLVLVTLAGLLIAVGGSIDLVARTLELSWAQALGRSEAGLVIAATSVLFVTPLWLWLRFLRRRVWRNSTRAIVVADRVATALGSGAAAWVLVQVAARVIELSTRGTSVLVVPASEPWLTFVAAGAAALVGIVGAAIRPRIAILEP